MGRFVQGLRSLCRGVLELMPGPRDPEPPKKELKKSVRAFHGGIRMLALPLSATSEHAARFYALPLREQRQFVKIERESVDTLLGYTVITPVFVCV